MKFHIHQSGEPARCESETTCGYPWHYLTQQDARAAYEAEMQPLLFPKIGKSQRTGRPARFVATHEDLNSEFAAFQDSIAATAPAVDRGDWRGALVAAAALSGDLTADQSPNTSVNGYHDPTADDEDDLSMFECF